MGECRLRRLVTSSRRLIEAQRQAKHLKNSNMRLLNVMWSSPPCQRVPDTETSLAKRLTRLLVKVLL